MTTNTAQGNYSIIALDKFIQATRDSGYKGTASAISELIDNSIQAGATAIDVSLMEVEGDHAIEVSVLDNGCGMDPFTLRQALRFGGSTRFGDRGGLGRYGMGLPNSSLSQARRVAVYTWQETVNLKGGRSAAKNEAVPRVFLSYLDVDEIAKGELEQVPPPRLATPSPANCKGKSGTMVVWQRCDRLDNRRISTLTKKISSDLGRRFRHFLWDGLKLRINGAQIEPVDPLFLRPTGKQPAAKLFGEEITYEVMADPADPSKRNGYVTVRFAELPVHEWQRLSNDEKRELGISKGAGVSIVRAGREVDSGWFFMGTKRRENYDDWWRCEIQFEPILDEVFGITHTKQQIHPQAHLLDALTPDLEATARALNTRARKAHNDTKAQEQHSDAEKIAADREHLLPPLAAKPNDRARALMKELKRKHPRLREPERAEAKYTVVEAELRETVFFSYAQEGERLALVINPNHPFYRRVYRPLADGDSPRDKELRSAIDLLLLAAARTEASTTGGRRNEVIAEFKKEWSDALATFLNN